ncbi:hypothetical protein [Escherichia coli]|uniref:hypothetical protein n=1 Tax=Escherichia coli TaxID=562 RepID=UPI0001E6D922|nr:hypothetical phage protein [Escherichia coli ETEC H10407]
MTALNKQALLIENGQLVADTLRHLADNEIDSDYFAITSTSENGTEIEHELVITDYALQAAGTVDELVRALEAAEKRIAELEAVREVFLRAKALMYQSGGAPIENSLNPIDAWLYDAERAAAGIGVKGE